MDGKTELLPGLLVGAKNFRTNTEGDICTMRIIVDKYLLALFDNDRQVNLRVIYYIIPSGEYQR